MLSTSSTLPILGLALNPNFSAKVDAVLSFSEESLVFLGLLLCVLTKLSVSFSNFSANVPRESMSPFFMASAMSWYGFFVGVAAVGVDLAAGAAVDVAVGVDLALFAMKDSVLCNLVPLDILSASHPE